MRFDSVESCRGKSLSGATWYGWFELLLFVNSSTRFSKFPSRSSMLSSSTAIVFFRSKKNISSLHNSVMKWWSRLRNELSEVWWKKSPPTKTMHQCTKACPKTLIAFIQHIYIWQSLLPTPSTLQMTISPSNCINSTDDNLSSQLHQLFHPPNLRFALCTLSDEVGTIRVLEWMLG